MSNRLRLSVSALAMPPGVMWLATTHPAADLQPPSPAAKAAKPCRAPRTPDLKPDLQGFWSNATYTPLQRAQNVTKEFYTPEEFEKVKKDAIARDENRTTPGTTADVHYDFTQFGLDKSQHTIVQNLGTSADHSTRRTAESRGTGLKRRGSVGLRRRWSASSAAAAIRRGKEHGRRGSRCIIMGGAGPPMRDAGYNSYVSHRPVAGERDGAH